MLRRSEKMGASNAQVRDGPCMSGKARRRWADVGRVVGLVLDVEGVLICSMKFRVKSSAGCQESCVGQSFEETV